MRQMVNCPFSCVVIVLVLLSCPALGEERKDKTLSPYFFVQEGDSSVDSFPLKETTVDARINGVIAEVFVSQKYVNQGSKPINARYIFPASTRATVHGMNMIIGERVVTARISERGTAKREFAKARHEGKSASLLEQQRPNVFNMNVANIMPGDEVRIELRYTELLVPSEGTYEFVYPTVVGPRYSNQPEAGAPETDLWVKSPYLKEGSPVPASFGIHVTVSTGIPLQELACPSHRVDVQWESKSIARVSLEEPKESSGNRDFILNYRLMGKEIQSGLMLYKGETENFFLLMVQPPERVQAKDIPPREFIFILDVSGSMHGFPLATAKTLIRDLIGGLRERDKFNVILFSGSSCAMSSSSVPATQANIARAIQVIDSRQGGGGTELSPALTRGLSLPRDENTSRSVLIITDGFISAERDVFEIIRNNLNNTNVFSFGIGSSVNRFLIEGMAKAGLGEPFVVTRPEEARVTAERFRDYVQSPVLTRIRVGFKGFEAYDVEPPSVPDLFARRPLAIFGKWRGNAEGLIEVAGKRETEEYAKTFRVSEADPGEANSALRYLWARTRIARLSDFGDRGAVAETKNEVTSLGLAYSILTPYTSFVAVMDAVRNPGEQAKDVNQPLPLPLGVSNLAVGGGCSKVPEPELGLLVALFIFVSPFVWIYRRWSRTARNGA
ncbi:MAG: trypsin [Deltaproteobacteria bacterium HGW-Deltaproteobacteria-15]|nr:MAG: trypsin [Deltaproteobacteria bacterium HGW-Deltaproteobacteria-15]